MYMKLVITVLFVVMLCSVRAQNVTDMESVPVELQEEYIANLFTECKLVYCDFDSLGNGMYTKKMEVEFFDTTFFFAAYLESSSFTKNLYEKGAYECTFIQMDDGGNGLEFDNVDLDELRYLKSVVNAIMRQTPRVQYTGNCPGTD